MHREAGFTIVELIVVMVVIAILSTLAVSQPIGLITQSRDSERDEDVKAISRQLEQDYTNQVVNGIPQYPPTDRFTADITAMLAGSTPGTNTAATLSLDAVQAPRFSGSSVVPASTNSTTNPNGPGSPTATQYIYQPIQGDGSPCRAVTDICVLYRLFYYHESGNSVITVKSMHQQ